MQNYSPSQQDQRIMSWRTRASKWWTDEELKNISLVHEYHFSLNGKYKNTHFALNEEHTGLLTYITLYLALLTPTHGEERVLSNWQNEKRWRNEMCL
jgi:hypothetical protein